MFERVRKRAWPPGRFSATKHECGLAERGETDHRPAPADAGPATTDSVPGALAGRTCKSAFASGVTRDAISPVDASPDADSGCAAEAAWTSNDRPAFIAAARAMRAAGQLGPRDTQRLAQALFDAFLDEEALAVLLEPASEDAQSPERMRLQAQLWLRLGVSVRAVPAVEQARTLAVDPARRLEIETLERGLRFETGQAEGGWDEICALARALLVAGQAEQTCAVLKAGLQRDGETASARLDEVLELAFAAFRTARPGPAAGLLAAMGPLCMAAEEGPAWFSAVAALNGFDDGPAPSPRPDGASQTLHACLAAALAACGRWRAAIRRYVPPHPAQGLMAQVICELARCVGRDVASNLDLAFRPPAARPRVFDVFPFNGERALLELKLAEMGPWVDGFVVVEAQRTFTGHPKPLRFPDCAGACSGFEDKIVYLPVDDFPPHLTTAWAREFFQRDQAAAALKGRCSPDDIVILSDVDEIIRREAVDRFQDHLAGADLQTFRYFLNFEEVSDRPIIKTVLTRAKLLARNGCSYLRIGTVAHYKHRRLADAGWHFTNMGAPAQLEHKFRSFSHEEWGHLDQAYFEDLLGRIRSAGLGPTFRRRPLEEMPDFIRNRQGALAEWLL